MRSHPAAALGTRNAQPTHRTNRPPAPRATRQQLALIRLFAHACGQPYSKPRTRGTGRPRDRATRRHHPRAALRRDQPRATEPRATTRVPPATRTTRPRSAPARTPATRRARAEPTATSTAEASASSTRAPGAAHGTCSSSRADDSGNRAHAARPVARRGSDRPDRVHSTGSTPRARPISGSRGAAPAGRAPRRSRARWSANAVRRGRSPRR